MINQRTPLAAGRVAELYEWGDGRVVKLWRMDGQADAEREARIARAAYEDGAATPKVIEVVAVEGRAGIVFERVDGPTMVTTLTTQPWSVFRCARQFAELQANMHRCPAPPELISAHAAIEAGIRRADGLTNEQKAAASQILAGLPKGDHSTPANSQTGPSLSPQPESPKGYRRRRRPVLRL